MTTAEILTGLNEQIANAEATLYELNQTTEGLRKTLTELRILKGTMILLTGGRQQEAVPR